METIPNSMDMNSKTEKMTYSNKWKAGRVDERRLCNFQTDAIHAFLYKQRFFSTQP